MSLAVNEAKTTLDEDGLIAVRINKLRRVDDFTVLIFTALKLMQLWCTALSWGN